MSHRHPVVMNRLADISDTLRRVLALPLDFELLFCAGGARHQYELIAMNYLSNFPMRVLKNGIFSSAWYDTMVQYAPQAVSSLSLSDIQNNAFVQQESALYCVVVNETADGYLLPDNVDFKGSVFADLTSDLTMRQCDFSAYDLFFAATGKALGLAGMSVLGLRRQWLERSCSSLMPLQSYAHMHHSGSLYATPALVCMDAMGHTLDWIEAQGGVSVLEERQRQRSSVLYSLIDMHQCYDCAVPLAWRSIHNVCFALREGLADDFLAQAEQARLYGLRGHARVGGMRISLTHGVTDSAFMRLCEFIDEYGRRYG
jgi:phosphoserine aminotransferase